MHNVFDNTTPVQETRGMYRYFTIDGELYGIESHHILYVTNVRQIIKIQGTPRGLRGYLKLGGSAIPVYSLSKSGLSKQTRVVVIWLDDAPIGLVVDSLQEAAAIERGNIFLPKNPDNSEPCRYISGIAQLPEEQTVLLLTRKSRIDA